MPDTPLAPQGDESELYRALQPQLLARLHSRVAGSEQTLEDACSHTWVQLMRYQPERGEALAGWLYVVAHRAGGGGVGPDRGAWRPLSLAPWGVRLGGHRPRSGRGPTP